MYYQKGGYTFILISLKFTPLFNLHAMINKIVIQKEQINNFVQSLKIKENQIQQRLNFTEERFIYYPCS